jgi:hypothetical protein
VAAPGEFAPELVLDQLCLAEVVIDIQLAAPNHLQATQGRVNFSNNLSLKTGPPRVLM